MNEGAGNIFLLDDDELVLRSLKRLLLASGYCVQTFQSAEAMLGCTELGTADCCILDLGLPGIDGLAAQEALKSAAGTQSIIFLTGRGDIPASVKAMKAGAVDFLTKPVDAKAMLAAVEVALACTRVEQDHERKRETLQRRLAGLTPREAQVMDLVVAGKLNKQIAADLGTVEKTVKVHRGRMMTKMGVRTVADLVRLIADAPPAAVDPNPAAPGVLDPGPTTFAAGDAVRMLDE
ncbi:Response regulator protein TodT [Ensifer sp. M14]|uniref:response regulator transcription factor n=1 Tax=Ensifer sp. M14 TaxID=2203782 RepID=UPI000E1DD5F9|nr:response regulator [Ensifer sp. M14]RDL51298.1 Response regulator protein TodT [Ensifer sp. M14]